MKNHPILSRILLCIACFGTVGLISYQIPVVREHKYDLYGWGYLMFPLVGAAIMTVIYGCEILLERRGLIDCKSPVVSFVNDVLIFTSLGVGISVISVLWPAWATCTSEWGSVLRYWFLGIGFASYMTIRDRYLLPKAE